MVIFKKSFFGLLFLLPLALFTSLAKSLQDYNSIWSFSPDLLAQTVEALLALILASFLFTVFATLSSSWSYSLPVITLASLTPFLFLDLPSAVVAMVGYLVSLILALLLLDRRLKNYLTFQPAALLIPTINQVITLILLITSLSFYLNTSADIKQNGFKLPEALINTSLQMAKNQAPAQSSGFQIPADQLAIIKDNPELLKQYGLDPSILESVPTSAKDLTSDSLLKTTVQTQMQKIIQPYLGFIPIILTVIFFLSLKSLASLLSILLPTMIWLTFWILEKVGFTKYQIETRQVKKLVV